VNSGLGYRILEAREYYFWSDKVIAGMITIGAAVADAAGGAVTIRCRSVGKIFRAGVRKVTGLERELTAMVMEEQARHQVDEARAAVNRARRRHPYAP